jgi:hypothetical protein
MSVAAVASQMRVSAERSFTANDGRPITQSSLQCTGQVRQQIRVESAPHQHAKLAIRADLDYFREAARVNRNAPDAKASNFGHDEPKESPPATKRCKSKFPGHPQKCKSPRFR